MKHLTSLFSNRLMSLGLLLVGLLVPIAMTAQDYCIDVGGINVTSENCDNITGPTIHGKVKFDPATRTLTLRNATINSKNDDGIEMESIYWSLVGDDITIELQGTNIINVVQDDNYSHHGIALTQTATITGPGTLVTNYDIRTYGTDLEIKNNCKVTAEAINNDTYYGHNAKLTLSGRATEIFAPIYGFEQVTLNDELKSIVPRGGYYETINQYMASSDGQYAPVVYIARDDYTAFNTKLWVKGKNVGEKEWAEIYDVPVDEGTATYDPYSKTLTLNDAKINITEDNKYGITNFDPNETSPDVGGLLNIVVNGTCRIWCTDMAMKLNGGIINISGDGKLALLSDDQSAVYMYDKTIINIYDTNVSFETIGGPAIKGEYWTRAEAVNIIHSSLMAYSPTYTTDNISEFNLLKCKFQDDSDLKGEYFGFDEEMSGSITYNGNPHRGRVVIKPFELYRYTIYIGHEEVTSENQDDPTGDGAFSYDPVTSTLTMKKSTDKEISTYHRGGLTIRMENDATTTSYSGIRAYGGCPLTITGQKKLRLTSGYIGSSDPLTLKETDVEVARKVFGSDEQSSLTVRRSRLKAEEISGFNDGITLLGCYIASPSGAKIKNGAIVDVYGNVVTTGVTILPMETKKGDVNADGAVDVADIATVISIMAGYDDCPYGDVNGDGTIDVADIAEIISIMAS